MLRLLVAEATTGLGRALLARGKKTRPWRVLAAVVAAILGYSTGDDELALDELAATVGLDTSRWLGSAVRPDGAEGSDGTLGLLAGVGLVRFTPGGAPAGGRRRLSKVGIGRALQACAVAEANTHGRQLNAARAMDLAAVLQQTCLAAARSEPRLTRRQWQMLFAVLVHTVGQLRLTCEDGNESLGRTAGLVPDRGGDPATATPKIANAVREVGRDLKLLDNLSLIHYRPGVGNGNGSRVGVHPRLVAAAAAKLDGRLADLPGQTALQIGVDGPPHSHHRRTVRDRAQPSRVKDTTGGSRQGRVVQPPLLGAIDGGGQATSHVDTGRPHGAGGRLQAVGPDTLEQQAHALVDRLMDVWPDRRVRLNVGRATLVNAALPVLRRGWSVAQIVRRFSHLPSAHVNHPAQWLSKGPLADLASTPSPRERAETADPPASPPLQAPGRPPGPTITWEELQRLRHA